MYVSQQVVLRRTFSEGRKLGRHLDGIPTHLFMVVVATNNTCFLSYVPRVEDFGCMIASGCEEKSNGL